MNKKVYPTKSWLTGFSIYPFGEIPPPDPNGVSLDSNFATYLVNSKMATLLPPEDKVTPQPAAPKQKVEEVIKESVPEIETNETDVEKVIDYLNKVEPEQISKDITGIGEKTAKMIVDKRPLTAEILSKTLSPTQIESVKKFLA